MQSLRLSRDPQLLRASHSNPCLVEGSTGTGVAILQDLLADLGVKFVKTFAHGKADGIFGKETLAAIKGFQTRCGLRADGIVGPKTLAAFDAEIIKNDRLETRAQPTSPRTGYW